MNTLTRWLALALLAPLAAWAQVYPYFPPPGMSYNATTGQLGVTGPVLLPAIAAPAAPVAGKVLAFGAATSAANITSLSVKDSFGGVIALGYEQHMVVANQTGSTLAAGNLVYVNGATGGGVPTVALAKADSLTTLPALGYTQYAIPNAGTGEIHLSGSVTGVTTGFSIGQKLYVSDSVAGAATNAAPTTTTSYVEQVGIVTSVGSSGAFQLAAQTPVAVVRAVVGGGTGLGTLTAHGVLLGEGTSNMGSVAAMAADTLLQGQGVSADPAAVSLVNCGSATQALAYSTSTHTFSCQTISSLSTPVTVANGGTGLGTLPVHGLLLGEATSNVGNVAAMAADTLLQGQGTGADPAAVSLLNCGSATQALAYSTSTHTFSCQTLSPLSTPVTVANGGTGLGTLPVHGVLLGEATSNVGNVAAMAADTLLQGQGTGADPAAVSLLNCGSSTQALAYSTSTHTFSCQTITGGGGGTVKVANGEVNTTCTTASLGSGVQSLTAQSTGVCTIVYTNSLFAVEPSCNFTPVGLSPQVTPAIISTTNVNQVTVQLKNLSGTAVNIGFKFTCIGS